MVWDVHVDVRQRTCRLAFLFVCWDNQSSSLCDSDPEFRGIMTSWGQVEQKDGVDFESRVPFTAHSSESFSVQGRDTERGCLRLFGSFLCKIDRLGGLLWKDVLVEEGGGFGLIF